MCDHEACLVVHDCSSGDRICTGCGLVLEAYCFDDHSNPWDQTIAEPTETVEFDDTRKAKKFRKLCDIVRTMGHAMKLQENVVDMAIALIAEALKAGHQVRDASCTSTAASALYYSCKVNGLDRAEAEIAANCNVTTKQLTVMNKHFRRSLGTSTFAAALNAPPNPMRLIPRFLDALCLHPAVINIKDKQRLRTRSEDIGMEAFQKGTLEGKSPECCCITFLYKALLEFAYPSNIIENVCARCGLTPNTIHNALSLL